MNLSGKVALITGAAQGLGKAFSESLVSRGAKVCLTDIKVHEGQITTEALKKNFGNDAAFFMKCDVTSEKEFANVFQAIKSRYGRLDILVNNAGIVDEKNWRKLIEINLLSVMQGTQLGIETMSKEHGGNGGVIINISSAAGLTPVFNTPAYCASKFGVVGYTRSLADNLIHLRNGLRFCCLCPAFTDTDIIKFSENSTVSTKEIGDKIIKSVGINKVSTVADGFMELVTDENNNGAVMTVTARDGIQYKYLPKSKL
ncbi:hypothetical protein SNE40_004204 [Patella caerulea]|uniref:15-hydroxyprostaglandin dehydrogenase [NAD(+)] n=1 Tax=Patella caerulea TaxID=87958 RepID=A0AAN8KBA7_PATCE